MINHMFLCEYVCFAAKPFAFEVGQAKEFGSFWGNHSMIHPKTTLNTSPVLDRSGLVDCIGRGFESGKTS